TAAHAVMDPRRRPIHADVDLREEPEQLRNHLWLEHPAARVERYRDASLDEALGNLEEALDQQRLAPAELHRAHPQRDERIGDPQQILQAQLPRRPPP